MSLQLLDTTSGAGDTGKAGGDKINAMLTELFGGRRGFPNEMRILTAGDSKAVLMAANNDYSGLKWLERIHPYNGRVIGTVGKSGQQVTTAAGHIGSDSVIAEMVAAIHPTDPAKANVMLFQGFTNDSGASIDADMAVFRKIHLAARTAGAALTIIMGLEPTGPTKFVALNHVLRMYAEANDDCWFIDTMLSVMDPTAANYVVRPNSYFDGVHERGVAAQLKGQALAREFQRRGVPRRIPDIAVPSDAAARGTSEYGNMFRGNGPQISGGNAAGMTVTGGAGVTGAANWPGVANTGQHLNRLNGTMNGTMALAISRVPSDFLNKIAQRTDLTVTRLTLSGTPDADTWLEWSTYVNMYQAFGSTSTPYVNKAGVVRVETIWGLNALTGLYGISGDGQGTPDNSSAAFNQQPALTFLAQSLKFVPQDASSFGIYEMYSHNPRWLFKAGVPISGSIDCISAVARIVPPAFAPAA